MKNCVYVDRWSTVQQEVYRHYERASFLYPVFHTNTGTCSDFRQAVQERRKNRQSKNPAVK